MTAPFRAFVPPARDNVWLEKTRRTPYQWEVGERLQAKLDQLDHELLALLAPALEETAAGGLDVFLTAAAAEVYPEFGKHCFKSDPHRLGGRLLAAALLDELRRQQ